MTARSKSARPSRRSASETRSIVLDAAVDLIEERGFSSLKVSDISRISNVSEVLIYRYFVDRQGLLTAALVELWERYMTHPIKAVREVIANLPDDAITPESLASLAVPPHSERARKSRWARLQVLAASPENAELKEMIRKSQSRANAEHELLIEAIRAKMPGTHLTSVRMMRMLNNSVIFGFVEEDFANNPISDDEFREFLVMFYSRTMIVHAE